MSSEHILLLIEAKNHILRWWGPEGKLPPAKSYELVERVEEYIATHSAEWTDEEIIKLANVNDLGYLLGDRLYTHACDMHISQHVIDFARALLKGK